MPPSSNASLSEWLQYIEAIHPSEIDLGLDRLTSVFNQLISVDSVPFVFTVAGTNGKGTTTGLLSALSGAAGQAVGWYSSPHLQKFNERVRINQQPVSDTELARAFAAVEAARGSVSLSYFEYTTLAAFYIFAQQNLDVWVLEIGLGGRLDAVNVVEPDISIVTNIGLDHQAFLGNDLTSIAHEKLGIARSQKPLVTGSSTIPQEALEGARAKGAQIYYYGDTHEWNGRQLRWGGASLSQPELKIPGANAAAALQAFSLSPFSLDQESVLKCLARSVLPGRLQELEYKGRKIVLDVGHNPHAGAFIAAQLATESYHVLIGMLEDKDAQKFVQALRPITSTVACLSLAVPRGRSAQVLASELQSETVMACFSNFNEAIRYYDDNYPGENLLIGGSFYTVCAALEGLET